MPMEVVCELTGQDGNAFGVMGRVKKSLRQAEVDKSVIEQYSKDAMSGDYDNLLRVSMAVLDAQEIEYS